MLSEVMVSGSLLLTLIYCTSSPAVTKAAAFCLGNLVRDCPNNGRLLVASGGVEALIDVINDVNDDDASKKVRRCDCCEKYIPSVVNWIFACGSPV